MTIEFEPSGINEDPSIRLAGEAVSYIGPKLTMTDPEVVIEIGTSEVDTNNVVFNVTLWGDAEEGWHDDIPCSEPTDSVPTTVRNLIVRSPFIACLEEVYDFSLWNKEQQETWLMNRAVEGLVDSCAFAATLFSDGNELFIKVVCTDNKTGNVVYDWTFTNDCIDDEETALIKALAL
jgi:hypothetical protein